MAGRGESLYGPGKHAYFVRAYDAPSLDKAMAILKGIFFTMDCVRMAYKGVSCRGGRDTSNYEE
jgi:hypothetical protein